MSDFPPPGLEGEEDSSKFSITREDPTVRTNTDGGYIYTRPRYTRTPSRTFTTGFTFVTEEQRQILEAFWNAQRGGSDAFTYTLPTTGVESIVRFKGPYRERYVGIGPNFRWNIEDVTLEEV